MAYAERPNRDAPDRKEIEWAWSREKRNGIVPPNKNYGPPTDGDLAHVHDDGDVMYLDWPDFGIHYTFNPKRVGGGTRFKPNETILFDRGGDPDTAWISAERGTFIPIEEVR